MQGAAAPHIIDVRRRAAFDASERMIANAVWCDPEAILAWIAACGMEQALVVYCVHGHEVSQRCAEALEKAGFAASYLEGGFERWSDEGHPTMPRK
jgi:rhodanese-related sulfurtransferase